MTARTLLCLLLLMVSREAVAMPSFGEVQKAHRRSDAQLLDRRGEVIHELRVDPDARRLEWTPLKDISPALVSAVLHAEDRRFQEHGGIDWKAAGAAAFGALFSDRRRGASTITMQVASLIGRPQRTGPGKRTIGQKWDQMQAARELERNWSKAEILEAYMNLVTFRGELQGIAAASRGLFDKAPGGIDRQEALLLASLIRSPNALPEQVGRRACILAGSMKQEMACDQLAGLAARSLSGPYHMTQRIGLAPQAARKLLKKGSTSAASTLDARLQRFASETLRYHLAGLAGRNVHDGAVLVADNRTGEILAYVGSSGELSSARHVDAITARRQAGSTLKPFLYGLAFDRKLLRPASLLLDSPLDIPAGTGVYRPENYDNDFKGPVQVRQALASSLNVPAVRTLSLVGAGPFLSILRSAGFERLEAEEHYGFSIALGTADVTLSELVNAYRTLANGGVRSALTLTPAAGPVLRHRVYSAEAAYLVSDILSDREARSLTFGLENPLATKFWTAVKTGTSKDMRDNWCIGYSRRYTVGVWVGNAGGEPMWNVSGVTGAAPVWNEVMSYLHAERESLPPGLPERLPEGLMVRAGEGDAPDQEQGAAALQSEAVTKIVYPVRGMIIALDPDIPEEQQRVFFEIQGRGRGLQWRLNGESAGRVPDSISWKPRPGTYTIALVDGDERTVDAVKFHVKGN